MRPGIHLHSLIGERILNSDSIAWIRTVQVAPRLRAGIEGSKPRFRLPGAMAMPTLSAGPMATGSVHRVPWAKFTRGMIDNHHLAIPTQIFALGNSPASS
jgi:hypothetical protein